ncbi:MAG: GNAT family N-acetyltransferase, partial [Actinomycetes bacterium]
MSPTLHTARLVLTPVGDHDLAPLHAHWNDPQVARWLWDANPVPLQTVADLIATAPRRSAPPHGASGPSAQPPPPPWSAP